MWLWANTSWQYERTPTDQAWQYKSIFVTNVNAKRINLAIAELVTSWTMKQSIHIITLSSIIINVKCIAHVVGNSFQWMQWWQGILYMSIICGFQGNIKRVLRKYRIPSHFTKVLTVYNIFNLSHWQSGVYILHESPRGRSDNICTFGKKWGGLFVLGDFCANIDKI